MLLLNRKILYKLALKKYKNTENPTKMLQHELNKALADRQELVTWPYLTQKRQNNPEEDLTD